MVKSPVRSVEDLVVYQRLVELHLKVNALSIEFPKHELYELGSQLRRSSNAVPAILAETWNNKHVSIYLEGINRALGELRETRHHLKMADRKGYLKPSALETLLARYEECGRMLRGLELALMRSDARSRK
jgi:four helix bundle protein